MIPLTVPHLAGNEWKYVKDCLDTGWISSVGSYVTDFEKKMTEFTGAKYAVACMNGTAALHVCQRLVGVQQGDYVIIPNITFIATANAVSYTGAEPLMMDVDSDTWQMDLNLLEQFFKEETIQKEGQCVTVKDGRRIGCIMPVHVLGNMCDMERLMKIANLYNVPVIEDSTESLGSSQNGKQTGTFGQMGCFSYNGNKIISTGGGGMIVTNDEALAKRAKHLTTQAKIHPEEYIHDEIGYNYRLVNILAAVGVAQMEQLPDFLIKKKYISDFYQTNLKGIGDIAFQKVEAGIHVNDWLFTIKSSHTKAIFQALKTANIIARPFWMPMNQLEMFKDMWYYQQEDKSNAVYHNCLSIPCSTGITDEELTQVVQVIKTVFA
jgi:aminotransferase in exopolysaccharide biosynthesis